VGQQARQQFFGYVVFLGAHCAYGQSGLRRRLIVRLHKILHTLPLTSLAMAQMRRCSSARCCWLVMSLLLVSWKVQAWAKSHLAHAYL
ncbi:hypothetical protein, partial [Comamonas sp. Z1]|uniref:hypothetical protein n=1 Tax=Comamonas sp. Z1 TaxID=2601246 RepID=UPI001CA31DFE